MKHTLLLSSLTLLLAACGSEPATNVAKDTNIIPVKVMPVGGADKEGNIVASGQFTTDDETNLSFKTGGIISDIYVKEGDAVRKGQLLASLHLTEINAEVSQLQLSYEKAQRDHQRTQRLYADSVATLEQLQNTQTALQLAEQQLNSARFNRNYSAIHAPKDGFVLHKLANAGQLVNAGTPVLQTNGAAGNNWLLRVGLSDRDWAALKIGDKADVTVQALPGRVLNGTVSRKAEGIDVQSGTLSVDIKLDATQATGLAAGMFGQCKIHCSNVAQNAWPVPYDAVLDGNGSEGFVFVTSDGKTARKVPVTIAGIEKEQVMLSGGVKPGEQLIISGSAYLTDQSPIRIIP
ncbi:efflux RND transporter periplasmic adaptor subunit [Chitinophaga horti]|uniref:Efflux RND transporter periplasmic adaptor subunit n=1 Tax=Chitinophaga horti TaxID=2920382 RepID=A0ABY6J682_9BACT|nr:efflux RND transporter periplasmic adaptor subunit [Chitinophaga horti]UYQ94102.1 efflux RND transporter periplasmic adaptor subunit [Chitinophaga horti]